MLAVVGAGAAEAASPRPASSPIPNIVSRGCTRNLLASPTAPSLVLLTDSQGTVSCVHSLLLRTRS